MSRFNYLIASQEEVNQHVARLSHQAISQMLAYHIKRGNEAIVEKIKTARELAKKNRAITSFRKYMDSFTQKLDKL
jgi:hypothetical protein